MCERDRKREKERESCYFIFDLNRFVSRTRFLIPRFNLPRFFAFLLPRRAVFFLTGDIAQWHLPVGMKDLNLGATKVAGKSQLIRGSGGLKENSLKIFKQFWRSVHSLVAASSTSFHHSSFSHFLSSSILPFRRGYRADEPSRGREGPEPRIDGGEG